MDMGAAPLAIYPMLSWTLALDWALGVREALHITVEVVIDPPQVEFSGKQLFNVIFMSQVSLCVIPFVCYSHPNCKKTVFDYPSTICSEGGG